MNLRCGGLRRQGAAVSRRLVACRLFACRLFACLPLLLLQLRLRFRLLLVDECLHKHVYWPLHHYLDFEDSCMVQRFQC